jgi:hypothetical protein
MNLATRAAAAIGAALLILPVWSASALPARATVLHATLAPSGDADGSGMAMVTLRPVVRRVCATISWSDIDKPTAAHIHRRSDGQVVVDLTGAVTGGAKCSTVSRRLVRRIAEQPGRYYVNVHNRTYPAGAVQGSLGAHHM